MGVLRTRVGPVGHPFAKGNPGGGRKKGVPNKATQEIKEFARAFLMSEKYRRNLERRINAGTAPQLEVLLHHYGFGKPRELVEISQPTNEVPLGELLKMLTEKEAQQLLVIFEKMRAHAGPGGQPLRPAA
jgi:hypothetical protein